MSRAAWEQLPDDVWARVFSCLLPPDVWVENESDHSHRLWGIMSAQLVCRKFRAVLMDNPSLCCNLALHKQHDNQQLKPVVHWVKQHASAITHLSAGSCSQQCLETVLTVMQQDHKLLAVSAFMPSPYAISLLANISRLTWCTLMQPYDHMRLKPLASLSNLGMLSLECANTTSEGLETLPHLTALRLNGSHIRCSHSLLCTTSLLELDVTDSSIAQFHDRGVLACTQLESLRCVHGVIEASDARLHLKTSEDDSIGIPADLANLASLTSLVLRSSCLQQAISFIWASKLTSLQNLIVNLPFSHVQLSSCIAPLTSLTYLSITAQRALCRRVPCIVLDIECTPFHMLKSASFTGAVKCDKSLYNLAALQSLESLVVCDKSREGQDEGSAREAWMKFAHWLGVHRPTFDLRYSLEDASESDYSSDG